MRFGRGAPLRYDRSGGYDGDSYRKSARQRCNAPGLAPKDQLRVRPSRLLQQEGSPAYPRPRVEILWPA